MITKIFLAASAVCMLSLGISGQTASTSAAVGVPSTSTASTTKSKSSKGPVFRPTKDQIKQVQTMLKEKKVYKGEPSGTYDDDTRAGIKSFQKDNGLKETGTLNRATLEKFGVALTDAQKAIPVSQNSYAASDSSKSASKSDSKSKSSGGSSTDMKGGPSAPTEEKPKKPAPFRATLEQIKAAQKMMKDGKMYSGDETGKLDDATREGLKKYQQANGVKVTGTLNQVTLEKMGITLTDQQKASSPASSAAKPSN